MTNQPVIARGEVSFEELEEIHNKMETLLGKEGAYLDAIYYCPHMLKSCRSIKSIIDKEQITIVHSHHRMAAFYAELVAPKSVVKVANLIQERYTAFYISTTWVDNDHYSIRFCPVYFERPILDESI